MTCETASQAVAITKELNDRRALGVLPGVSAQTIFLGVPDPARATSPGTAWCVVNAP
eukprot:SAG31_NODE_999_length_10457_cov_3.482622_10_plen_57_part_00